MKEIEQTINSAMEFDITPVMERYAEETRLPPEVLEEHQREIKRFLALCAVSPGKYAMRGPLDELWHTFILFTSLYANFCRRLGGGFIHHLPESPRKATEQRDRTNNSYLQFLTDYERVFKEQPPFDIWPRPLGGDLRDPSCDQCGNYCAQTCVAIDLMPPEKRF
ncbi:MAG: hypothetical protein JOZ19_03915 [Rubrobacter sp.]|nr:hypothetical protein [Rubrobacter sp.]